jgi:glycosyltransferase involved in cell wall biosynthesis
VITGSVPAVSVIIPAYNVTKYIPAAIESVLAQTFKDFEVIVVNDGCPDTANLERVLARFKSRIRYLYQENRGLSGARNTAIREARAPLIALLDSDDMWHPEYLAVQVSMIRADPTIDVLYPNALYFGDVMAPRGRTFMDLNPSDGDVTFLKLLTQQCNVMVSVTARRAALIDAGLFDEGLRSCEDWDMWLRVVKRGGHIAYHRRPLVHYRQRAGSLSADPVWMFTAALAVLEKVAHSFELTTEEQLALASQRVSYEASRFMWLGKRALRERQFAVACEHFRRANRTRASKKLQAVEFAIRYCPRLCLALWTIQQRLARYRPY